MRAPRIYCRNCREPFSDANVYSEAGWVETRISGLCELCFDAIADVALATGNEENEDGNGEAGRGA